MLTGATEFPNLHEAHVAVLDAKPVALAPYGEAKFKFDALPPMRLAAPFEALRDRSDQILKDAAARGRKSFSPISARLPTSPRARPLPRAFSRPAGSRRSIARGLPIRRRSPPPSRPPARRSPACARPTRSMPGRRLRPQRPFKPPAQDISIWQAGRASRKPRSAPPALTILSLPAATRWRRCRKPIG